MGYAACYGVFPELQLPSISLSEVLEEHNATMLQRLRPGPDDEFALHQFCVDADKGFCSYPLSRAELFKELGGRGHRLIPRCVITQSSEKQRVIDDAAVGGQSASSRHYWPDACRHSAMSGAESRLCVVTFWRPHWRQPAFQLSWVAIRSPTAAIVGSPCLNVLR